VETFTGRETQDDGFGGALGLCSLTKDTQSVVCKTYPVQKAPAGPFVDVGVPGEDICALRASGSLECWRKRPASGDENEPKTLDGTFKQLQGAFALSADGRVLLIPTSTWVEDVPPLAVLFGGGVPGVCGIDLQGNSGCWGKAGATVLDAKYEFIALGTTRACGIREGHVECWGRDADPSIQPPAIIGTFLVDRDFPLGRAKVPSDFAAEPLPEAPLPKSCAAIALTDFPEHLQALARSLGSSVPRSRYGVNFAKARSNYPALYRCGDEYLFRWIYASITGEKAVTEEVLTVTIANAASRAAFAKAYQAAKKAVRPPPDHGGPGSWKATKGLRYGSHTTSETVLTWERKERGDDGRETGFSIGTVSAGALLVQLVTTRVGGDDSIFATLTAGVEAVDWALEEQKRRRNELPIDPKLEAMVGKRLSDLYSVPGFRERLNQLLGKHRRDFEQRSGVMSRIRRFDDIILADACQARVCIFEQAAVTIDLHSGGIAVGIVKNSGRGKTILSEMDAPTDLIERWVTDTIEAIQEEL
jgi:hypothetical protein